MITTKISVVGNSVLQKLQTLHDPKPLLRPVAFDVVAMMTGRIHEKGEAADGSKIGTYNNRYLKLRQKKYKRKGDPQIIVSLTRQLENNWSVIATDRGWGIGFTNPANAQKMKWVEQRKDKKIAALTKEEKAYAIAKIKKLFSEALG